MVVADVIEVCMSLDAGLPSWRNADEASDCMGFGSTYDKYTVREQQRTPRSLLHGNHDVTSLCTSPVTNTLHMNNGRLKLSFWSDNASSSPEMTTPVIYRTCYHPISFSVPLSRSAPTENSSTTPSSRNSSAATRTDSTNAQLPSSVFDDVGDHR